MKHSAPTIVGMVFDFWLHAAPAQAQFPPCFPEFFPPPCPDFGPEIALPSEQAPTTGPAALVDPPTPAVNLRVRVPATIAAGQEIEYHIYIKNTSSASAHHVTVHNPVPEHARFVRSSPEPTLREPDLQWRFGTLNAGEKKEITLVLLPADGAEINNCARVQFEHGQCVRTKISRPTLQIRKEGPTQANLNDTVSFRITVTNTSDVAAANVLLADVLPSGLQHASNKDRLSWIIGKLNPGESRSVDYQLTAKSKGKWCNKAIASADGGVREEAESCVTVVEAKLKVSAFGPVKGYLQTPVRYAVTVSNEGTAELVEVHVAATLPAELSFVSASAGGQAADKQVLWTTETLDPGATRTLELVVIA